ncbi:mannosyltransferase OCH1 [Candidatus Termititenax aidoneus]|uniref:Mannosyltransferase OCH1 n=1 Tax=Termititenax aidoneus TaxID=2218524 RepID=A0A388T6Y3_TERA1|nr:mannosyltransferase OCH1 [Candidatus Termititenax aidoneus]
MPEDVLRCLQTWRDKMPDYELVLWDKNKFDINSVTFVREACAVKKWAFAADYIRLYALYTEGGLYLDTDVIVKKSFTEFLKYDFFSAVDYVPGLAEKYKAEVFLKPDGTLKDAATLSVPGIGINAAILGGIAGHNYLKECLLWYETHHFDVYYNTKYLAPDIYAKIALKYGFRYKDELQYLDCNMVIFPSSVFATNRLLVGKNAYAIHYTLGSWVERNFWEKLLFKLTTNNFLRKIFGKKHYPSAKELIG